MARTSQKSVLLALLTVLLAVPQPALADSCEVTETNDGVMGSLRLATAYFHQHILTVTYLPGLAPSAGSTSLIPQTI